eukprot:CAMPEP_0171906266 /NCGR_PEP_ID=MMETSP0993-20121228/5899_1 /TAXON_ID=483369 /ORGANISM="non described non described, Strain CCMP2098" /LENGTH=271 /DNA_ID=CAMNT_0012538057 /DNA_START=275 /DNA_END=1087 /DNA_ORIENTATION=-
MRSGELIRVFNGRDGEWLASLQPASPENTVDRQKPRSGRIRKKDAVLLVAADKSCLRPQPYNEIHATLMFSLIKSKQVRLVVEKATELGVTSIRPVVSERVQQGRTLGVDVEMTKLLAVATNAAEQSERLTIPSIEPLQTLSEALCSIAAAPCSGPRALFICEERSDTSIPLLDALDEMAEQFTSKPFESEPSDGIFQRAQIEPIFLVGPEGGWAEGEVGRAIEALNTAIEVGSALSNSDTYAPTLQVWRVSLGSGILRAETASLMVLSVW